MPASALIENQKVFDAKRGLTLSIKNKNWIFLSPDEVDAKGMEFVARPKGLSHTSLTWRVDKPEAPPANAKKYAEKWLKDFPKFGLELESSKEAKYGSLEGYEMDFKKQNGNLRWKQFIVGREKEFWIFTCSAPAPHFKSAWNGCKNILQSTRINL